jgi:hypothetical protein
MDQRQYVPPPASAANGPYQHWLDDAANMGLMLFRMRNDSKRERILTPSTSPQRGTPPVSPPPPMSIPREPPPFEHHHHRGTPPPTSHPLSPTRHHHHQRSAAPQPPQEVTPRTNRALQTPTVATHSTGGSHSTHGSQQPSSFYLALD